GWTVREDPSAQSGYAMADTPNDWFGDADHYLTYAQPIDLSGAVDPQLVFWYRGSWGSRVYSQLQISTNGGGSWDNVSIQGGTSTTTVADWTRFQHSLASYTGETILMRLRTYTTQSSRTQTGRFDAFSIQERIPAPTLFSPVDKTIDSLRLHWEFPGSEHFAAYRLYRHNSTAVNEQSHLVTEITDPLTTTWTDSGLDPQTTYYYRVYAIDENGGSHGSSVASAQTLPLPYPSEIDFSGGTLPPGLLLRDGWTLQTEGGRDGTGVLRSSSGDYPPGADYQWQTGLDLRGSEYPALLITHHFDLGESDYGFVEVSTNRGSSWQIIHAVQGREPGAWRETRLDLSPWAESSELWLRFRLSAHSWNEDIGQGWFIDSLTFTEMPTEALPAFRDDGVEGMEDWLNDNWFLASNDPYTGSHHFRSNPWDSQAGENALTLRHSVTLPEEEPYYLTYRVRGNLARYLVFYAQVSTNHGRTWNNLSDSYLHNESLPDWTTHHLNLESYAGETIRLRFFTNITSGTWRSGTIDLDQIGIGPLSPSTPTPIEPINEQVVTSARPSLTINNAESFQGSSLSYRFEVYADEALTDLRAQVPSVASGTGQTTWQVDTDLANEQTYYWRARASDGSNSGEWSDTAIFHRSFTNDPPYPVEIAGPENGALMLEADSRLFFYPTTDPNVGDEVVDYQIQLASDPYFTDVVLNRTEIVLPSNAQPDLPFGLTFYDLPGTENLEPGLHYWRIRARDTYGEYGLWSSRLASIEVPRYWQRWQALHFDSWDRLDETYSGAHADPEGSGISNFLRMACGIPFGTSDRTALPRLEQQTVDGDQYLSLRFQRNPDWPVEIFLEASSDLLEWSIVPHQAERTTVFENGHEEWIIRDELPVHETSQRFLRVRFRED
ncbi:MAG: fibronectin type III domain-containing protein, partial [Opitutales bacterium]|nr:fibronectin type III domain-containing protein [Opitutales bacterium]